MDHLRQLRRRNRRNDKLPAFQLLQLSHRSSPLVVRLRDDYEQRLHRMSARTVHLLGDDVRHLRGGVLLRGDGGECLHCVRDGKRERRTYMIYTRTISAHCLAQ